jgi:ribonuclease Y
VNTQVVLVVALVALVIGLFASALLLMLIRRLPRAGAAPAHEPSPVRAVDLERERLLDQRELELTALAAELAERGDQLDRRERKPRSKQSAARPAVLAVHRSGMTQPFDLDERARQAITTAIQRVAASQTADVAVIGVPIPNEEMKGRLIGRDGRNIRSFEQLTGVSLLVDDTPGAVELSAFDPRRREVARQVLVDLISDGRVHPGRIEDSYARAEAAVEQACLAEGRAAAAEVDITDLADDVAALLGALRYRHSYGQNVLAHLVESARLASLLAAEIGVDPAVARRAALLHDLGKGLTDAQLPHAVAGAQFARRHGESDEVAHAIEAHHGDVEPTTIAALLVQAADAISASRPGARHEDRDLHQLRLSSLEELALAQPGVAKAYAIDAGRELRVVVEPSVLDDAAAAALAADLAERIQQQFDYPASITITVVRELRASAVAR